MKIATFNIQNLFHRDKTLQFKSFSKSITDWTTELDQLIRRLDKRPNDLDRIRELSFLLGFERNTTENFGVLRRRNGELYLKQGHVLHETKASELTNWQGWMPIHTVPLSKKSIQHKARILADSDADILVLQGVEDRASLVAFHDKYLMRHDLLPYRQLQVLEGNDTRGQAFGILLKPGYHLEGIKSYGHLTDENGQRVFEKDCQEYHILNRECQQLTLLCTEFSEARPEIRKQQAEALAKIYDDLLCLGREHIVVCGTFHDPIFSNALRQLFGSTDLTDISKHQAFHVAPDGEQGVSYHRLGAYRKGVNLKQRDYLLFSHSIADSIRGGGMDRRGVWPSFKSKWPLFPTLKQRNDAASEHPLIWMELSL